MARLEDKPGTPADAPASQGAVAREPAGTARIVAASAAVWLVWGSTYLAIRFALESFPPFLMSGARFLVAGSLLLAFLRARGESLPDRREWRGAAIVGALLLLCGNGAVAWAEQTVPSGLVALTVAIVPALMAVLDWLGRGPRPTGATVVGLVLGFGGVGILLAPDDLLGRGAVDPFPALVLVGGSVAWATGSLYSRSRTLPASPLVSTGAQMICGGVFLSVLGVLAGEWGRLAQAEVTWTALLAWVYLVIFGAIVAYSAYIYLLRHAEPTVASTYAYVNPLIAVLLGWAVAGEPLNARVALAVLAIVPAVALIVTAGQRKYRNRWTRR